MPMKIITLKLNHHLDIPNSKGATRKKPLKTEYHKTLRIVTSKINTAIVLKMEQFSVILQQWNKKMQMEWQMTQQ